MKWRNLSLLTAVGVIIPLGVYGAQLSLPNHNSNERLSSIAQQPADAPLETDTKPLQDPMNKLFRQLDLTSEQSSTIATITEKSRSENATIHQELEQNRQQFSTLLGTDASSEELQIQHENIQNLHRQLSDNRFKTMLEIREILTPEQRTQLAELMKAREARNGPRHHRR